MYFSIIDSSINLNIQSQLLVVGFTHSLGHWDLTTQCSRLVTIKNDQGLSVLPVSLLWTYC